jgi:hypothetical protein
MAPKEDDKKADGGTTNNVYIMHQENAWVPPARLFRLGAGMDGAEKGIAKASTHQYADEASSQPPNRKGVLERLLSIPGLRILLDADGSKRML